MDYPSAADDKVTALKGVATVDVEMYSGYLANPDNGNLIHYTFVGSAASTGKETNAEPLTAFIS